MKIIYTAGRFRGATPWEVHCNVARAEYAAYEVAEAGAMPLCPHMNTKNFDGLKTGDFWIEGTLELLRRSDAIYVFDSRWRESTGTVGEIRLAFDQQMPIFFYRVLMSTWVSGHATADYILAPEDFERMIHDGT